MNRFDYVKYDNRAQDLQQFFKGAFTAVEQFTNKLPEGRAKSLAMTKLEEAYMWIGKAIRDDQFVRNGSVELQEERNDG